MRGRSLRAAAAALLTLFTFDLVDGWSPLSLVEALARDSVTHQPQAPAPASATADAEFWCARAMVDGPIVVEGVRTSVEPLPVLPLVHVAHGFPPLPDHPPKHRG
jgi:hypothetical protein